MSGSPRSLSFPDVIISSAPRAACPSARALEWENMGQRPQLAFHLRVGGGEMCLQVQTENI